MEGYDLGMYPLQRAGGIDLYSRSSGGGRVPGSSGGHAFLFLGTPGRPREERRGSEYLLADLPVTGKAAGCTWKE